MYSFCVSRARIVAEAQSFDWFTFDGPKPVSLGAGMIRSGQRFGVRPSPCGQQIQLLTAGALRAQTIDLQTAKRLAKHIKPEG